MIAYHSETSADIHRVTQHYIPQNVTVDYRTVRTTDLTETPDFETRIYLIHLIEKVLLMKKVRKK
jgi:hypothetical protein